MARSLREQDTASFFVPHRPKERSTASPPCPPGSTPAFQARLATFLSSHSRCDGQDTLRRLRLALYEAIRPSTMGGMFLDETTASSVSWRPKLELSTRVASGHIRTAGAPCSAVSHRVFRYSARRKSEPWQGKIVARARKGFSARSASRPLAIVPYINPRFLLR